jgi:uncharacterized protein (DUF885 family)
VPLDTVQHYEDYIARLHQIPPAFEQTIEVLRQGEKDGLMPVRILIEQMPAQCQGTIYRRSVSKQQLSPRFDIWAFHDEILSGASLPLDMLEARVDNWIGSQLPNGAGG